MFEVLRWECHGRVYRIDNGPLETAVPQNLDNCIFWWDESNKLLSRKPNVHKTGYYPIALGTDIGKIGFNDKQKIRISEILNSLELNYHYYNVAVGYGFYSKTKDDFNKDWRNKRANLAKISCDREKVNCSVYADYLYSLGNYKEAGSYFKRGDTNIEGLNYNEDYIITRTKYKWNYSEMMLYHYDELNSPIIDGEKYNKPLTLKQEYYKEMKALCEDRDDMFRFGITDGDCNIYRSRYRNRNDEIFITKVEIEYIEDSYLSLEEKKRKYKLGVTKNLREKSYIDALKYFTLLDKINFKLPDGMLYYKAISYEEVGKKREAKSMYRKYISKAGINGLYYDQALSKVNQL
ncbi:hypothetical protein [Vibrio sp. HN007]|uniref:hypothetical protein n=1 Tax=Vibrio iocasae TaxID=3098914 RepID=UPI0035D4B415